MTTVTDSQSQGFSSFEHAELKIILSIFDNLPKMGFLNLRQEPHGPHAVTVARERVNGWARPHKTIQVNIQSFPFQLY